VPRTKVSKNKKENTDLKVRPNQAAYKEPEAFVAPVEKGKPCQCGHGEKLHYGGDKGWCNVTNCVCQAYTK
jgi:hypothetical protein